MSNLSSLDVDDGPAGIRLLDKGLLHEGFDTYSSSLTSNIDSWPLTQRVDGCISVQVLLFSTLVIL